jgi:hypothetical protein
VGDKKYIESGGSMEKSNFIKCEVMLEDETFVGRIRVLQVPRVGEYIWFSEERLGHTSYIVEQVAHWVGMGDGMMDYQNVALFVIPTNQYKEGEA